MNLDKECIRKTKVDGVTYYQVPEIRSEECFGCVCSDEWVDSLAHPACKPCGEIDSCWAGIWTTAAHKDTYLTAYVLHRLEGAQSND